jgi:hypothetical protein
VALHELAAELLDVGGDGVEERRRGRGGAQAEGKAQLPVEVAATERGVVAVGVMIPDVLPPKSASGRRAADAVFSRYAQG